MQVHKKSKSLVLKVREPEKLTAVLNQSRILNYKGVPLVQANHTIETAKVLNNMGFKAPSPIKYYYDWPGPFEAPYEHQLETSAKMSMHERMFVLNDMGTGKTQSALWAVDFLKRLGKIRRVCIVAPKSTCNTVWANDIQRTFMGKYTCNVLLGEKKRRLRKLEEDADFYVINHDGIKTCFNELAAKDDIDLFILDEASDFSNPISDRWKAMFDLTPPIKWFWAMTATPVSSSPVQAWGLAKLLRNGKATMTQEQFKLESMTQVTKYRWVPKPGAHEMAFDMLQPAVRYAKEDCLDLPPVVHQHFEVDMSTAQKKAFKELSEELVTVTDEGHIVSAENAAGKLMKLLQICCGFLYSVDEAGERIVIDLKPIERLKALTENCTNTSANSIVFCPFRESVDKVVKHLKRDMPSGTRVHFVDGRVSDTQRQKVFDEFENKNQAGMKQVLVAHPKTAAHGLTLVSADLTMWYGPTFSLDQFKQANERFNRPGQTKKMLLGTMSNGPLENGVYAALRNNANMQQAILDLYKGVKSGNIKS